MGLRFKKSINLGGAKINFSKTGIGASLGGKGLRVTKMANGRTRTTASLPGTGISYVKESSSKSNNKNSINISNINYSNNSDVVQKNNHLKKFNILNENKVILNNKFYNYAQINTFKITFYVLSILLIICGTFTFPIGIIFIIFGLLLLGTANTYKKILNEMKKAVYNKKDNYYS